MNKTPTSLSNDADIIDSHFMRHALAMANMAVGTTAPNPSVGCVIVKDGKILAAAHTAKGGRPHAETIALSEAGRGANGATIYVTLEPCAHYGKTPPCALGLINAGIKRVVIACKDPFLKVDGKGVELLKNAGIEVKTGVCEQEAELINEGFFSVIRCGRPFITLKTATSLDGKLALGNGTSKWITGEESRSYVHLMRARHDAVITGIGTVIADDPLLTCRLQGMDAASPIRVVLDTNLNLPATSSLTKTACAVPCYVATLHESIANNQEKARILQDLGVRLLVVKRAENGKICIEDVLIELGKLGINTAMIEAGATINTQAVSLNLVDKIAWFKQPMIIGNDGVAAFGKLDIHNMIDTLKFTPHSQKIFGKDSLDIFNKTRLIRHN
jgi:diaminohydroxyphosphoribosylaminopyrimidine deaminase/5-amino-6-(5-phosphoribosylamino)uracil reductase